MNGNELDAKLDAIRSRLIPELGAHTHKITISAYTDALSLLSIAERLQAEVERLQKLAPEYDCWQLAPEHDCWESVQERVEHPSHYTHGSIEPIDAIADWKLNFNLGNAVKYIARAEHKGSKIDDLKKAVYYLEYEIDMHERRQKEAKNGLPDELPGGTDG